MKKLKIYGGGFDGRNSEFVATNSKSKAAKLLGISLYSLKIYGGYLPGTNSGDLEKHLLANPDTVYIRKTSYWNGEYKPK